jgi:hypothetical protein
MTSNLRVAMDTLSLAKRDEHDPDGTTCTLSPDQATALWAHIEQLTAETSAKPCSACIEAHGLIDDENLGIPAGDIADRVADLIALKAPTVETPAPQNYHCTICGGDVKFPAGAKPGRPEEIPARDEGETPEEYRKRLQLFGVYAPAEKTSAPLREQINAVALECAESTRKTVEEIKADKCEHGMPRRFCTAVHES